MAGCSKVVGTSRQDPPRDAQSQRSAQQGFVRHLTLEQIFSFPREGSGDEGQHLNHSDAAAATTYKRATDKPVHDGAQEQDSGARVIIIKVPRQYDWRPGQYGGLE